MGLLKFQIFKFHLFFFNICVDIRSEKQNLKSTCNKQGCQGSTYDKLCQILGFTKVKMPTLNWEKLAVHPPTHAPPCHIAWVSVAVPLLCLKLWSLSMFDRTDARVGLAPESDPPGGRQEAEN